MRMKYKNMLGRVFSRLTVIDFDSIDEHQTAWWRCKCVCGTEVVTRGDGLRAGRKQSCGCLTEEKLNKRISDRDAEKIGQIFGRLTIVKRMPNRKEDVRWLCKCTCGADKEVSASSLYSGRTRSCGCLNKEILKAKLQNLADKVFGRLTVINLAPKKGRHTQWHCICSCGQEVDVSASSLVQGTTVSCGCYKKEVLTINGKRFREEEKWIDHSIYKQPTLRTLRAYKLSPEDHKALWDLHGGLCHICWFEGIYKPLRIDHDHKTGKVRGLLCDGCNSAEGHIMTIDRAKSLVSYMCINKEEK